MLNKYFNLLNKNFQSFKPNQALECQKKNFMLTKTLLQVFYTNTHMDVHWYNPHMFCLITQVLSKILFQCWQP